MKREREADRGSGETFLDETQDVVELLCSKIRKTAGESPSGGVKKDFRKPGKRTKFRKGDCSDGVGHSHPLLMIKNP